MPVSVSSTVLVVAPDADLRRSLAFMLSAEGYGVLACDAWPPQDGQLAFDAVVIDHSALDRKVADPRLTGLRGRAIVLASQPDTAQFTTATLVRKPLLDRALLDALSDALAT
jgi:hypothetical protein